MVIYWNELNILCNQSTRSSSVFLSLAISPVPIVWQRAVFFGLLKYENPIASCSHPFQCIERSPSWSVPKNACPNHSSFFYGCTVFFLDALLPHSLTMSCSVANSLLKSLTLSFLIHFVYVVVLSHTFGISNICLWIYTEITVAPFDRRSVICHSTSNSTLDPYIRKKLWWLICT